MSACKYPPRGFRSFGPIRAKYYEGGGTRGGGDYHHFADEVTLVIPQIETREAIKDLDAIFRVLGISAIYVGPSDLSMALGKEPRKGQSDPEVIEARQNILQITKRHSIPAGIHTFLRFWGYINALDIGNPARYDRRLQPCLYHLGDHGVCGPAFNEPGKKVILRMPNII